jgi:hypothetical protein
MHAELRAGIAEAAGLAGLAASLLVGVLLAPGLEGGDV